MDYGYSNKGLSCMTSACVPLLHPVCIATPCMYHHSPCVPPLPACTTTPRMYHHFLHVPQLPTCTTTSCMYPHPVCTTSTHMCMYNTSLDHHAHNISPICVSLFVCIFLYRKLHTIIQLLVQLVVLSSLC